MPETYVGPKVQKTLLRVSTLELHEYSSLSLRLELHSIRRNSEFFRTHNRKELVETRLISRIGLVAEVFSLARVKGVPYLPVGGGIGVVILDHDVDVLLSYNPTNIL